MQPTDRAPMERFLAETDLYDIFLSGLFTRPGAKTGQIVKIRTEYFV
jgi:hypothetical protein